MTTFATGEQQRTRQTMMNDSSRQTFNICATYLPLCMKLTSLTGTILLLLNVSSSTKSRQQCIDLKLRADEGNPSEHVKCVFVS